MDSKDLVPGGIVERPKKNLQMIYYLTEKCKLFTFKILPLGGSLFLTAKLNLNLDLTQFQCCEYMGTKMKFSRFILGMLFMLTCLLFLKL
jgi:hypothetical protein